MTTTNLHIKNMCCDQCIGVVRDILRKLGHSPVSVSIGETIIAGTLSNNDINVTKEKFQEKGFCIAEKNNDKLIVKIHAAICRYINEEAFKDNRKKKPSAKSLVPLQFLSVAQPVIKDYNMLRDSRRGQRQYHNHSDEN